MAVQLSRALCLLVLSAWLDTLGSVASASAISDLEPPVFSLHARRAAKRSTSEELLMRESEALQDKISKVDEALTEFKHPHENAHAMQSLSSVAINPSIMLQNSPKDQTFSEVRSSSSQPSLVQSSVKARSGSRGFFGDLAEWNYVDAHTLPERNKIVLALIELIVPLGWFGMDRLYLGQPLLAGLKMIGILVTCVVAQAKLSGGYPMADRAQAWQGVIVAFFSCGIISAVWGMLDAFVIAFNCIMGSKYLYQFGMGAWFGGELEITIATIIGVLIIMLWVSVYCIGACFIGPKINWKDAEWYAQAPGYGKTHHMENVGLDINHQMLLKPNPHYPNTNLDPMLLVPMRSDIEAGMTQPHQQYPTGAGQSQNFTYAVSSAGQSQNFQMQSQGRDKKSMCG